MQNTSDLFYPTTCAHGLSGGSGSVEKIKELENKGIITHDEMLSMQSGNGGKLNPDWVEWLMGWGIGWTDLDVENDSIFWLPISEDPADDGRMNRLTDVKKNRVSRIKALGNGQVPLCAAVAFEWGLSQLED